MQLAEEKTFSLSLQKHERVLRRRYEREVDRWKRHQSEEHGGQENHEVSTAEASTKNLHLAAATAASNSNHIDLTTDDSPGSNRPQARARTRPPPPPPHRLR